MFIQKLDDWLPFLASWTSSWPIPWLPLMVWPGTWASGAATGQGLAHPGHTCTNRKWSPGAVQGNAKNVTKKMDFLLLEYQPWWKYGRKKNYNAFQTGSLVITELKQRRFNKMISGTSLFQKNVKIICAAGLMVVNRNHNAHYDHFGVSFGRPKHPAVTHSLI